MRFAILAVLLSGCSSDDEAAPNETAPPAIVVCTDIAQCRADEACQLPNASTKGMCIRKCAYQGDNARESPECPTGSLCIGVTGVTVHAFCYRRCTAADQCGTPPPGTSASCENVQGASACVFRTK